MLCPANYASYEAPSRIAAIDLAYFQHRFHGRLSCAAMAELERAHGPHLLGARKKKQEAKKGRAACRKRPYALSG